jgi:hypothetical protein
MDRDHNARSSMLESRPFRAIAVLAMAASPATQCSPTTTHIGWNLQHVGFSLAADGNVALFGHGSGSYVELMEIGPGGFWERQGLIGTSTNPRSMGYAVAVRGDTVVAGDPFDTTARGAGAVAIGEKIQGAWTTTAMLFPPAPASGMAFGISVAVAEDQAWVVAGAPGEAGGTGAAYVYARTASGFSLDARVVGSNAAAGDGFGGVETAAGRLFVSAPGHAGVGAVYVFERGASGWTEVGKLMGAAANEGFGAAMAAHGDRLFVGVPGRQVGTLPGAGEVVVFQRAAAGWSQVGALQASFPEQSAGFGRVLDAAGSRLAVGARGRAYLFADGPSGMVQLAAFGRPHPNESSQEYGGAVAFHAQGVLVGDKNHDTNGLNYPHGPGAVHSYELADYGQPLVACAHVLGRWGVNRARLLLSAPSQAGQRYLVLGSATGFGPIVIHGVSIPLSFDDYLVFTAGSPNSAILPQGLGTLDAAGRGSTDFVIPKAQLPALVGLRVHHAFVTFGPTGMVAMASNPVTIGVVAR